MDRLRVLIGMTCVLVLVVRIGVRILSLVLLIMLVGSLRGGLTCTVDAFWWYFLLV